MGRGQALTLPSSCSSWAWVKGQGVKGSKVNGQGQRVCNLAQILVTRGRGPVQVPHDEQGSGHGAAGECQLGVIGQFLHQTGTKYVNFYQESANKAFNFGPC